MPDQSEVSPRSSGGSPDAARTLTKQELRALLASCSSVDEDGVTCLRFSFELVGRLLQSHDALESQVSALRQEAATRDMELRESQKARDQLVVIRYEQRDEIKRLRQEAETLRTQRDEALAAHAATFGALSQIFMLIDGEPGVDEYSRVVESAKRVVGEAETLRGQLDEAQKDTERLDWLAARVEEYEHAEINYTDAWQEHGDYGSILSQGPREFWLRDDGSECGPTLRAALDAAARVAAPREPT